eukprot:TRINITY_DN58576_c0_g1_i1.p1 TRINITY_DN58576_c0_g1~~TRINITY_DN58576_c0_g1_i1.p1  ORF type:complete len:734 (-),score=426.68 TRINITY_DN58576_c0_g1_i1:444-2645(-)
MSSSHRSHHSAKAEEEEPDEEHDEEVDELVRLRKQLREAEETIQQHVDTLYERDERIQSLEQQVSGLKRQLQGKEQQIEDLTSQLESIGEDAGGKAKDSARSGVHEADSIEKRIAAELERELATKSEAQQIDWLKRRLRVTARQLDVHKNLSSNKLNAVESKASEEVSSEHRARLQAEEHARRSNERTNAMQAELSRVNDQVTRLMADKEELKAREQKLRDNLDGLHRAIKQMEEERDDLSQQVAYLKDSNAHKQEQEHLGQLRTLPEFSSMENDFSHTRVELAGERESRAAALSAWEKAENKAKTLELSLQEHQSAHEHELKAVLEEKKAAERECVWQEEQVRRVKEQLAAAQAELNDRTEEVTRLRVRLGGIQSEIRATTELEKLRAQVMVESMRTEMEWRQKVLRKQVDAARAKAEEETIRRLKVERDAKHMSIKLREQARELEQRKQAQVAKRRKDSEQGGTRDHLRELADIDAQIARLEKEKMEHDRAAEAQDGEFLPQLNINQRISQAQSNITGLFAGGAPVGGGGGYADDDLVGPPPPPNPKRHGGGAAGRSGEGAFWEDGMEEQFWDNMDGEFGGAQPQHQQHQHQPRQPRRRSSPVKQGSSGNVNRRNGRGSRASQQGGRQSRSHLIPYSNYQQDDDARSVASSSGIPVRKSPKANGRRRSPQPNGRRKRGGGGGGGGGGGYADIHSNVSTPAGRRGRKKKDNGAAARKARRAAEAAARARDWK